MFSALRVFALCDGNYCILGALLLCGIVNPVGKLTSRPSWALIRGVGSLLEFELYYLVRFGGGSASIVDDLSVCNMHVRRYDLRRGLREVSPTFSSPCSSTDTRFSCE